MILPFNYNTEDTPEERYKKKIALAKRKANALADRRENFIKDLEKDKSIKKVDRDQIFDALNKYNYMYKIGKIITDKLPLEKGHL